MPAKSTHDNCPFKGFTPPAPQNDGQPEFNAHIEGRVGRLEGAVENLTHEVQETSKAVRDIAGGLGKFKEEVLGHIGQATAPKWPLIASFVMIALTIISLGSTLVVQNMSGQGQAIAKLSSRMDSADEYVKVQARAEGRLEAWREMIDKKADKLDVDLQREMRLINENTDSKLQANDKATLTKLSELQSQIIAIKDWRLEHVQDNAKIHGNIEARLAQLDKMATQLEERQFVMARNQSQLDYLRPGSSTPPVTQKVGK